MMIPSAAPACLILMLLRRVLSDSERIEIVASRLSSSLFAPTAIFKVLEFAAREGVHQPLPEFDTVYLHLPSGVVTVTFTDTVAPFLPTMKLSLLRVISGMTGSSIGPSGFEHPPIASRIIVPKRAKIFFIIWSLIGCEKKTTKEPISFEGKLFGHLLEISTCYMCKYIQDYIPL